MNKITKYKKYILGLIAILFVAIVNIGIKYIMKPKYKELPEVILKENVDKHNSFAIMIQENGEEDKYKEYEGNTWPGSNYIYKEAKCVDNNGALVENAVTYVDGKATLTTNQTIYCTLYFDQSIIGELREKDSNGNLSPDLQGGMYRYQGTDNVSNWICFGTTDKKQCTNEDTGIDKYMYRIIGITEEGQMYLLKETFLKEDEVIRFAWDDNNTITGINGDSCLNGTCPEWNTSDLFERINGIANGSKSGSGNNNDNIDNNTDIFIDSKYYDYLKSGDNDGVNGSNTSSEWYNLIENHEWMYGDVAEAYYSGKILYDIETGQRVVTHYIQQPEGSTNVVEEKYTWPETNKVTAKVSLMYMHDAAYAYYDGTQNSTRGNPSNGPDDIKNSWIHFQKDEYNLSCEAEWFSTRWGIQGVGSIYVVAHIFYTGNMSENSYLYGVYGVRPVFYLSSRAKIADGDGTKANPYMLEM